MQLKRSTWFSREEMAERAVKDQKRCLLFQSPSPPKRGHFFFFFTLLVTVLPMWPDPLIALAFLKGELGGGT